MELWWLRHERPAIPVSSQQQFLSSLWVSCINNISTLFCLIISYRCALFLLSLAPLTFRDAIRMSSKTNQKRVNRNKDVNSQQGLTEFGCFTVIIIEQTVQFCYNFRYTSLSKHPSLISCFMVSKSLFQVWEVITDFYQSHVFSHFQKMFNFIYVVVLTNPTICSGDKGTEKTTSFSISH